MSTWLYQLNQKSWSPERYRLEIWENERWSWNVGREVGASKLLSPGDTVVFFYAPSGGIYPGFYGWAVVLEWFKEERLLYFRPVAPSNHLKMCPWCDTQALELADSIRGTFKRGTLWHIPNDLVPELRSGITSWVGGNVPKK
jgi:hypothetical protein